MAAVFGPDWIVQSLVAIAALGIFLALVLVVGDVYWPPFDLGSEPARAQGGRETVERRRLAAFPATVHLFLPGEQQ